MKKWQVFITLLSMALICGSMNPSATYAQDYVLKKNKQGGFFSRLFGGNKNKEKKEPVRRLEKEKPRQEIVKKPVYEPPPAEKTKKKPIKKQTIADIQRAEVGACTPQDMLVFKQYQEQLRLVQEEEQKFLEDSEAATKSLDLPRVPPGKDAEDIEQDEEFQQEVIESLSKNSAIGFFLNPANMERSMKAAMKCQDWEKVLEEKKAEREEREKKKRQQGKL